MTVDVPHTEPPAGALNRRSVLAGAGVLAMTGVLPSCATGDQGSDDEGSAAAGTVLGSTSEVPVGAGTVFTDHRVVVTQPAAGDFQAFSATCTHQGCMLRDVAEGTITCPCHGSRFDITDGSVVRGPAQEPLPRLSIAVEGSTLRLA
jgi:Rieske Fe-S protein